MVVPMVEEGPMVGPMVVEEVPMVETKGRASMISRQLAELQPIQINRNAMEF